MTPWEQLSRRDQLAATHYDFYKSVHGIRPRWMDYDAMTEADLEAELDRLSKEAEVQAQMEAEQEAIAIAKVENRIGEYMTMGAKDRIQAIQWIMDAEDANGDADYCCYLLGLPYGYLENRV